MDRPVPGSRKQQPTPRQTDRLRVRRATAQALAEERERIQRATYTRLTARVVDRVRRGLRWAPADPPPWYTGPSSPYVKPPRDRRLAGKARVRARRGARLSTAERRRAQPATGDGQTRKVSVP